MLGEHADMVTVDLGEAAGDGENVGRYRFRYRAPLDEYALRLGLRGRHQITNAVVAIHIAEQLRVAGFYIPQSAVVEELNNAEWPGRLEMARLSPSQAPLLLDGAHNADGARAGRGSSGGRMRRRLESRGGSAILRQGKV